MRALVARISADLEAQTLAMANGWAISMDPKALAAWQAARGGDAPSAPKRAPMNAQTLGIVMRQFPRAIKVN